MSASAISRRNLYRFERCVSDRPKSNSWSYRLCRRCTLFADGSAYLVTTDRFTAKQCVPKCAVQTLGLIFDVQYRAVCHAPAADLRSRNSS